MAYVTSKDGTRIAFDRNGQGSVIIMVNGALAHRGFYGGGELGKLLSSDFVFIDFDRRGRGESTDTLPYAVDREIEDIDALIHEGGGSAFLYGISSGACLALLTAVRLGPAKVKKLALYEPPYGSSDLNDRNRFAEQEKHMHELIRKGKRGDAVAFFIAGTGAPPEAIDQMRKTPDWPLMERVAHTLAYDYAILGDGAVPLPLARKVSVPSLVMDGGASPPFMHAAADLLGNTIPGARRKTLENQTHDVSPAVVAPVLKEFFLRGGS